MFDAILKPTNSYFQKGMTFCRSIYVKKVMKLLAFIFEQPSYLFSIITWCSTTQSIAAWQKRCRQSIRYQCWRPCGVRQEDVFCFPLRTKVQIHIRKE